MKAFVQLVAIFVMTSHLCGCATAPFAVQPGVSSGDSISVVGFVKFPGRYPFHEGMPVAEALGYAGGYGRCRSCQEYYDETGSHPTFDLPPRIQRAGNTLQLPKKKAEWMRFSLERDDEVKFRHILF